MSDASVRPAKISQVVPGSIADQLNLAPGDRLVSINGEKPRDLIDYNFLCADGILDLEVIPQTGQPYHVTLEKDVDADLGLEFETALFDGLIQCNNRCPFCFIDQQPPGRRESLYYKDDDYRLSFLYGSYLTLTNLTDREWERIEFLRLSPLYVSVHATEPDVRIRLLKNPRAGKILEQLAWFQERRLQIHAQVVLCPGINDGDHLERTIRDLAKFYVAGWQRSLDPDWSEQMPQLDSRSWAIGDAVAMPIGGDEARSLANPTTNGAGNRGTLRVVEPEIGAGVDHPEAWLGFNGDLDQEFQRRERQAWAIDLAESRQEADHDRLLAQKLESLHPSDLDDLDPDLDIEDSLDFSHAINGLTDDDPDIFDPRRPDPNLMNLTGFELGLFGSEGGWDRAEAGEDDGPDSLTPNIPTVTSVAIVPAGLTRFRPSDDELTPVTPAKAQEVIAQVQALQAEFRRTLGSTFVWLADEWFLLAGQELPPAEEYEDFPQIDNGVGSIRLFLDRFDRRLTECLNQQLENLVNQTTSLATGLGTSLATIAPRRLTWVVGNTVEQAFAPLVDRLNQLPRLQVSLAPLRSIYWGQDMTVTGLLTGQDLISGLAGRDLGDGLLIPSIMLKSGETGPAARFLDDTTLATVCDRLGTTAIVTTSAEDLIDQLFKQA